MSTLTMSQVLFNLFLTLYQVQDHVFLAESLTQDIYYEQMSKKIEKNLF